MYQYSSCSFHTHIQTLYYRSSKSTKIRSFYRKLNRWGFSILRGSNQPEPITAANLLQGRVSSGGTTKGVWHHPDFYRSRAVECLKMAMETGDVSCMLNVVHGTNAKGDDSGGGNNDGATKRSTKGKKRRSETLPAQAETDSPSLYFGQPSDQSQSHRMSDFSHRPSDFNLGDDDLNLDEFILPQVVATQQAQVDMSSLVNNSQQQDDIPSIQQLLAVLNGNPFGANVSNSFISGMTQQASTQQQLDASSALMNKRGRHDGSGNFNSFTAAPSNNFTYQPVSNRTGNQNQGNNNRQGNMLSASWTAGVTNTNPFSSLQQQQQQQGNNFDFAGLFNTVQEGQGENGPSPVPYMGQQQNFQQHLQSQDLQQEFQQQVQQQRQGGNQGGGEAIDLTEEDTELANFFENFAQTLKKKE